MSDTAVNKFLQYGTAAERGAFTPSPAAGVKQLYEFRETDTGNVYLYDTSWHLITSGLPAVVQLAQIVTSSSQATADFTSISGSYSTLKLVFAAQDTTSGTSGSTITMKVNNDGTSGNYTSAQRSGAVNGAALVTTVAATATGVQIGFIPNTGNTGMTGAGEVTIVNYAGTTFHKRVLVMFGSDDGTNAGFSATSEWRWKSTAAITRLTVTAGTAFTDGSVFTLYGLL